MMFRGHRPLTVTAVAVCCLLSAGMFRLHAQTYDIVRGETAAARLYVQWAENAMESGRWSEALIVLERGCDYADVSSDISYLLALVRSRMRMSRGSVLEASGRAFEANRWDKYVPDDARLLEAENLIAMKFYTQALDILSLAESESVRTAILRMLAYRHLPDREEFLRYALLVLDRYPRESEPARIFLDYLYAADPSGINSGSMEKRILDLVLQRLPVLTVNDPELAWMASYFIKDSGDAQRLVSAYRAMNEPVPASLLPALSLGLIDEKTALAELFNPRNNRSGLDIYLLENFYDLLAGDESKNTFRENLKNFSGNIIRDANRDGIPESTAVYLNGMLCGFVYDGNQDNVPELSVNFLAGDPQSAEVKTPAVPGIPALAGLSGGRSDQDRVLFADPGLYDSRMPSDRGTIKIRWEKYPAVLEAELDGERFIPRPFNFFFAPVQLTDFWDITGYSAGTDASGANAGGIYTGGILIPVFDPMAAALTRRVLIAGSIRVERPSLEFAGAMEVIELNQSIPVSAREYLDGRIISETDFLRGRPISQRVDLDLDGRLETFRHFRRFSLTEDGVLPPPEILLDYMRDFDYVQSDWTGDGKPEIQYF